MEDLVNIIANRLKKTCEYKVIGKTLYLLNDEERQRRGARQLTGDEGSYLPKW